MEITLTFLTVLFLSGQVISWSLHDFIVGEWILSPPESWTEFLRLMEFLEFSHADVEKAKEYSNSSHILIKLLDDTEGHREIEWFSDSPIGTEDKIKMKENKKFKWFLGDGREFEGQVEFNSADTLFVKGETQSKGVITCENVYKFDRDNLEANYLCTRLNDREMFEMALTYNRV